MTIGLKYGYDGFDSVWRDIFRVQKFGKEKSNEIRHMPVLPKGTDW